MPSVKVRAGFLRRDDRDIVRQLCVERTCGAFDWRSAVDVDRDDLPLGVHTRVGTAGDHGCDQPGKTFPSASRNSPSTVRSSGWIAQP